MGVDQDLGIVGYGYRCGGDFAARWDSIRVSIDRAMTLTGTTRWMQRMQMIPVILLAMAFIPAAIWALDRGPPLKMTGSEPASVKPGQWLRVVAHVDRDSRACDATVTAVMFDSAGTRFLLGGSQVYNAATLDYIDRITPGRMAAAAPLSPLAVPGRGHVVISISYRCNPLHSFWPINVLMDIPFEVQ